MLSAEAISQAVLASEMPVLPHGALTKPALAAGGERVTPLDMRPLHGILSYEPSEFLITALAGTPVSELQTTLGEQGQYLPFDPLFVSGGATIGGTVASGVSGPNRLLYGGLRDFVMEVELVDGLGKLVRGGGKVVKNAAGFDLPKLMVGSYGRLGILTEVTLKVFPQPQACATLMAELADLERCVAAAQRLLAKPLPVAALDMDLNGKLCVRFAGPAQALGNVLTRAAEVMDSPSETLDSAIDEFQFWRQRSEWLAEHDAGGGRWLVRIATTLDSLAELVRCLATLAVTNVRLSCAGSVAWISVDAAACPELDQLLQQRKLAAVAIKGATEKLIVLGDQRWVTVAGRIQKAMDPHGKFVAF